MRNKITAFKKRLKKILIVFGVISLSIGIQNFLWVNKVKATWLDSWYDNTMSTSTGIDYFEGQKRGYATFGSFSLRLPAKTDYLLSIEKPHLKVGCGGIDLFMGGFSFLNPDYLVEKLQAMLQAAPFIAFDIALQTLCPTCSETLKKAEAIIDTLNQIQLSECGVYVPRTVVDMVKNPSGFFKSQAEQGATEAQNKGFSDMWTKFWNKYVHVTGDDVKMEGVSSSDSLRGTADQVKQWIQNASDNTGYIEYLANQGVIDNDVAEIFRAYVGELYKSCNSDKTIVNIEYKKVCAEAEPSKVFDSQSKLWRLPLNSSSCVEENVNNIQNKIINAITGAYNKVSNKQPLSSDYLKLVQVSPVPIHLYLKSAVMMNSPTILYTIAPDVAKGVIYSAMLDLSNKMERVLGQLEYSAVVNTSSSSNPSGKAIQEKMLKEIKDQIAENKRAFDNRIVSLYRAIIGDIHKGIDLAMFAVQFESIVNSRLSGKYSSILANIGQ